MSDVKDSLSPSTTLTLPSTTPHSRPLPVREDCWPAEATSTLIDTWGRRYLELNRGNLRQKDLQDVADAVNALHGHIKRTHRTDVQCKNRIDTVNRKYKIEKTRVTSSNGTLVSPWPFFERLDALRGSNFAAKKLSPSPKISPKPSSRIPGSPPVALPLPLPYRRTPASATVVALPQKRPAADHGYFRRNYSAVAAAAAAAATETDEEGEESEEKESEREGEEKEGMNILARAIERFRQVYERVEGEKLSQMMELEKQRMQFAKDLEVQRMRMFMDTQVQLERIKRGKRSSGSSGEAYSPS